MNEINENEREVQQQEDKIMHGCIQYNLNEKNWFWAEYKHCDLKSGELLKLGLKLAQEFRNDGTRYDRTVEKAETALYVVQETGSKAERHQARQELKRLIARHVEGVLNFNCDAFIASGDEESSGDPSGDSDDAAYVRELIRQALNEKRSIDELCTIHQALLKHPGIVFVPEAAFFPFTAFHMLAAGMRVGYSEEDSIPLYRVYHAYLEEKQLQDDDTFKQYSFRLIGLLQCALKPEFSSLRAAMGISPESAFQIGLMYYHGNLLPRNFMRAELFLLYAAIAGHPAALMLYSLLFGRLNDGMAPLSDYWNGLLRATLSCCEMDEEEHEGFADENDLELDKALNSRICELIRCIDGREHNLYADILANILALDVELNQLPAADNDGFYRDVLAKDIKYYYRSGCPTFLGLALLRLLQCLDCNPSDGPCRDLLASGLFLSLIDSAELQQLLPRRTYARLESEPLTALRSDLLRRIDFSTLSERHELLLAGDITLCELFAGSPQGEKCRTRLLRALNAGSGEDGSLSYLRCFLKATRNDRKLGGDEYRRDLEQAAYRGSTPAKAALLELRLKEAAAMPQIPSDLRDSFLNDAAYVINAGDPRGHYLMFNSLTLCHESGELAHTHLRYAAAYGVPGAGARLKELRQQQQYQPLPFMRIIDAVEAKARQGDADSCLIMVRLCNDGLVLPRSQGGVEYWRRRAVENGCEYAAMLLGRRELNLPDSIDGLASILASQQDAFLQQGDDLMRCRVRPEDGRIRTLKDVQQAFSTLYAPVLEKITAALKKGQTTLEKNLLVNLIAHGFGGFETARLKVAQHLQLPFELQQKTPRQCLNYTADLAVEGLSQGGMFQPILEEQDLGAALGNRAVSEALILPYLASGAAVCPHALLAQSLCALNPVAAPPDFNVFQIGLAYAAASGNRLARILSRQNLKWLLTPVPDFKAGGDKGKGDDVFIASAVAQ